jgi:hypothetical protein
MYIRQWIPALAAGALTLICFSADRAWGGSFFGPSCYGARYAEEYPNRSHNTFGCGPGTHCTARHPLFKHRWFRKNQNVPVNAVPMEFAPPPVAQVSLPPAPNVPVRITPAPLPAGPPNPQPPVVQQTANQPF